MNPHASIQAQARALLAEAYEGVPIGIPITHPQEAIALATQWVRYRATTRTGDDE